jgi:hypothetical protein
MRVLIVAVLAASVTFLTPRSIDAVYAQTKQGYSAPKPRSAVRPYESGVGHKRGYDPDPFIQGEILRHRNSGWPD